MGIWMLVLPNRTVGHLNEVVLYNAVNSLWRCCNLVKISVDATPLFSAISCSFFNCLYIFSCASALSSGWDEAFPILHADNNTDYCGKRVECPFSTSSRRVSSSRVCQQKKVTCRNYTDRRPECVPPFVSLTQHFTTIFPLSVCYYHLSQHPAAKKDVDLPDKPPIGKKMATNDRL